jgi:hypothetical protein
VSRYDGPASGYDYGYALGVDPGGNVYVTGNSSDDFATVKYDADGAQQWVRRYDGPGAAGDEARAIAVDPSGNAFATGYSYGGPNTQYDYATIAYDAGGAVQWVERYNGPGDFYDIPFSVAVDGEGGVYVSGQSGGIGTGLDFATLKYSPATAAAPGVARVIGSDPGLLNQPNPFRSSTTIRFDVPPGAVPSGEAVRLALFDAQGRSMATLVHRPLAAGAYQVAFDGSALPSGVYYYRLDAGQVSATGRMIRAR